MANSPSTGQPTPAGAANFLPTAFLAPSANARPMAAARPSKRNARSAGALAPTTATPAATKETAAKVPQGTGRAAKAPAHAATRAAAPTENRPPGPVHATATRRQVVACKPSPSSAPLAARGAPARTFAVHTLRRFYEQVNASRYPEVAKVHGTRATFTT